MSDQVRAEGITRGTINSKHSVTRQIRVLGAYHMPVRGARVGRVVQLWTLSARTLASSAVTYRAFVCGTVSLDEDELGSKCRRRLCITA